MIMVFENGANVGCYGHRLVGIAQKIANHSHIAG